MTNNKKTALVTGANSGIGYETAALLAEQGFGKVIIVARTLAKADAARDQLVERTGRDVYELLAADLAEVDSAESATQQLIARNEPIDLLILNAGMSAGAQLQRNGDGIDLTFASTLIGHHILTMRLLEAGLLAEDAHVVIAGSEGARGDVPGMKPVRFDEFAEQYFDGDMEAALETIARAEPPYEFKPLDAYVTAKVYIAWWAAALARRLPANMTVNAVSPGSVPATNFVRNQSFLMRGIMMPMMARVGHLFGMAAPVSAGAQRYIDAGNFDHAVSGQFFASAPGKMTGPLYVMEQGHFHDVAKQEAFWTVIVRITHGVDYPATPADAHAQAAVLV